MFGPVDDPLTTATLRLVRVVLIDAGADGTTTKSVNANDLLVIVAVPNGEPPASLAVPETVIVLEPSALCVIVLVPVRSVTVLSLLKS
jgi:hypothetical protein